MTTLLRMLTDYGQSCQKARPASSRRTIVLVSNELELVFVFRNFLSLGRVSFKEPSMYAGSSRWPGEVSRMEL